MRPVPSLIALSVLALAGCSTAEQAPPPPLASEEVIAAAEIAPLGAWETSGRWNEPIAPFNVIGDIYYVGTAGVSSYLITTPDGHFLLDGALAQSATQIMANIKAVGFDIADVKFLLNSHAHIDHAAGLARLQRASGAVMVASAADKPTLEAGQIDYGPTGGMPFPPVRVDRIVGDGDTLALGGVTLTAHMTPGHTAGCTSWSMDVAGADGARHRAFFHCSSTVAGQALVPESYPGMAQDYRNTFARVRGLSADVFLANHGNFFGLEEKRARQIAGDANAFVDADGLQRFNSEMEAAFNAELAKQQAAR